MAKSSAGKFFGEKKVKSLWEDICDEFAAKKAIFENTDVDDDMSIATDVTQYSARRHTPVVYGKMVHRTPVDANVLDEFDPAVGHPAAIGLTMLTRPKAPPTPPPIAPPDPKTCSPKEYLESHIFPTLIPALIAMLKQAKIEKCFERKRFRFNGCDFLTEYLYNRQQRLYDIRGSCLVTVDFSFGFSSKTKLKKHLKNQRIRHSHTRSPSERESVTLHEIPFVTSWLAEHPRAPLPLSLQWNEDEAAIKIQAFYRGHRVRVQPSVAELRKWQKDWRIENEGVRGKINNFWQEHEAKASDLALPLRGVLRTSVSYSPPSSGKGLREKKVTLSDSLARGKEPPSDWIKEPFRSSTEK